MSYDDEMTASTLARFFDKRADSTERFYEPSRQSPFRRWVNRRFHSDIIARFNAAMDLARESRAQSVLDVGCGSGQYLAALSDRGIPRLVGIDVSPKMLELARRNAAIASHPNAELVQMDFADWNSQEKFDLVIAMGFFDYQSNPGNLLRKMRNHARSAVIASFPRHHWFRTPFRWVRRRLQGTRVYFYNVHGIRDLAQGAGFKECQITLLPGAGMNMIVRFIP